MIVRHRPRNTWLGRAGHLTEFANTDSALRRMGERVAAIRWEDTDEVTVRHIKGDGRAQGFLLFDERTLPAGTTDTEVETYAQERLA